MSWVISTKKPYFVRIWNTAYGSAKGCSCFCGRTLLIVTERFNWAVASCISRKKNNKREDYCSSSFQTTFLFTQWTQFKINCRIKYQLTSPFEGDIEFLSPDGVSQQPERRSCRWHHGTLQEGSLVLGSSDSWLSWWTGTTDSLKTPLLCHVAISFPPSSSPPGLYTLPIPGFPRWISTYSPSSFHPSQTLHCIALIPLGFTRVLFWLSFFREG